MFIYEVYYSHYCEAIDGMWIGGAKYFSERRLADAKRYWKSLKSEKTRMVTAGEKSSFKRVLRKVEVID